MANVLFSLGNSNNVGLLVCISELFGADSEQSSHRWSKDSEGTQCRDSNDQWLVFFYMEVLWSSSTPWILGVLGRL